MLYVNRYHLKKSYLPSATMIFSPNRSFLPNSFIWRTFCALTGTPAVWPPQSSKRQPASFFYVSFLLFFLNPFSSLPQNRAHFFVCFFFLSFFLSFFFSQSSDAQSLFDLLSPFFAPLPKIFFFSFFPFFLSFRSSSLFCLCVLPSFFFHSCFKFDYYLHNYSHHAVIIFFFDCLWTVACTMVQNN